MFRSFSSWNIKKQKKNPLAGIIAAHPRVVECYFGNILKQRPFWTKTFFCTILMKNSSNTSYRILDLEIGLDQISTAHDTMKS
jgi:hypothetical protein